jgi:hydroxymethylbilane synthase
MNSTFMAHPTTLVIGTRGSALARWQTEWVQKQLKAAWPELQCDLRLFQTAGDKNLAVPLPEIGGKGLFTEELENALRSGEIDLAVHSLKDLPIDPKPGLLLGAIGEREDPHDVLISRQYHTFSRLPHGARVGTSSLRRAAQVLALRPDLKILALRGNVETRIRKAMQGQYEAIVLAAAGVIRLGMNSHIAEYLSFDVMLPAPGQGAVAVQCRADDQRALDLLRQIDDAPTRSAVTAERAFLSGLGGGCSTPVAAYAQDNHLVGLVAHKDGHRVIRVNGDGPDPIALGNELAQQALAQGAQELLA